LDFSLTLALWIYTTGLHYVLNVFGVLWELLVQVVGIFTGYTFAYNKINSNRHAVTGVVAGRRGQGVRIPITTIFNINSGRKTGYRTTQGNIQH